MAGKHGQAISLVAGGEEQDFFKQILFSYRGVITLKTASDIRPLAKAEQQGRKPHHQPVSSQPHANRREESPAPAQFPRKGKPAGAPRGNRTQKPWERKNQGERGWSNHPATRRRS
jgi:hypothetical protein